MFHFFRHGIGQEFIAFSSPCQDQLFPGAGHGNIEHPPLLFDLIIAQRFDVRKDAVLHPDQIAVIAFRSFGTVNRDESKLVLRIFIMLKDFRIRIKLECFQKTIRF